ncbi:hypothetical protein EDC04DRAFT_2796122 [Pisolithus marmoratus]|nr:hypothetical protein EDC04DRAFT_2796122 [Pisolithus marmoratus]
MDLEVKVHINSIQAKETPEESTCTQSHIDSDRKHYLDAAILRIMVAKKELTYEQLNSQTIESEESFRARGERDQAAHREISGTEILEGGRG